MWSAEARTEIRLKKMAVRARMRLQPGFFEAVRKDTHTVSAHRGEFFESADVSRWYTAFRALRLIWVTDAFLAQVAYRARAPLKLRRVPLLPLILHKLSMVTAQLSIDDLVVMHPGVNIAHGQAVIGGMSEISPGCTVSPWVSIGLKAGNFRGPLIGHNVFIGSGAQLLGEFTVGHGAVIGAQSMVSRDVPEHAVVAGIPAKVIGDAERVVVSPGDSRGSRENQ